MIEPRNDSIAGVGGVQMCADNTETPEGLAWRSRRGLRARQNGKGLNGNTGDPMRGCREKMPER